jgi:hypothetical protein
VRAAALKPFAFDGGTLSIRATLQPVSQQQVRFDVRRDEFHAQRSASMTGSPRASTLFSLYPMLNAPQARGVDISGSPLLTFSPPSNDEQTPLVREFSYGNPYGSSWEPVAQLIQSYSFAVTNHDGSRSVQTSEGFTMYEPISSLASTPLRPRVSLPRDVKVDGISAQTPRILTTSTPVVSWEPPALGTVTAYAVRLNCYGAGTSSFPPVRIDTSPDVRSVRLPPGILTSGKECIVRIMAMASPGVTPERTRFTFNASYASATSASSQLTAP